VKNGRTVTTPAMPGPAVPPGLASGNETALASGAEQTAPDSTPDFFGRGGRAERLVAFITREHARHQAAVFRIGIAFVLAASMIREWPHRRMLYGDRAPWALDMAGRLLAENPGFTVLTWWNGRWWFELVYHATIVAAVLLMLGWRTRATSVFFMIGVLSLGNRNSVVMNGGDCIIQVMAIYLVFTRCGRVWSLDARRNRRSGTSPAEDRSGYMMWQALGLLLLLTFGVGSEITGWSLLLWGMWAVHGLWWLVHRRFPHHPARPLLDAGAQMLHNCAMFVIAVQICLIYATAGWYKIQGSLWQDGTALHYSLQIDYFSPWPSLSDLVASNMIVVFLLSYGTVILQVAFPFVVLNRRVKNVLIPVMILEHLGIAVLMGLTFYSLAAIVCDMVFLPTAFLLWAGARCTGSSRRLWERVRGVPGRARSAKEVAAPT
jgi:hypothetical protein